MSIQDNTVVYKGQPMYNLSGRLIESQNVSHDQVLRLVELHVKKLSLFDEMKATDDPAALKAGAKRLEAIEFAMQDNWNFTQDRGMHEWYLIPKCTCPKMDNADSRYPGSTHRIFHGNCPVHG